jgi:hypothetical protein
VSPAPRPTSRDYLPLIAEAHQAEERRSYVLPLIAQANIGQAIAPDSTAAGPGSV